MAGEPSAAISVVRATPAYNDAAIRLIEEYQDSIGVVVRDDRTAILEYLHSRDKAMWLAYADGRVVGCIAFRTLTEPEHAGEMKRLYVQSAERGHGIAALLLHALEQYAVECGCNALYLDSRSDLVVAIRFYERQGYLHCPRYNDNPQATVFMMKNLSDTLILRPFEPADAEAFRVLNEAWIAKLFHLEEKDREILNDPMGKILAPGGQIFVAERGGICIGCCALIALGGGLFELSKMAVAEQERGSGVGRKMLEWVVEQSRDCGVRRLYLESNSSLKNAIHLYEAVGFRHVAANALTPSLYRRADVFMEMDLDAREGA